MNFEEKYVYNKAADSVMKMFSDRDYFERKYAQAADSFEVLEHELSDSTFRIKVTRTVPTDVPVPNFAKKLIPGSMTVIQEDIWDLAARTGKISIDVVGSPVHVTANMRLIDGPKGGENHVSWKVDCRIPLIGGKIAKFVADDIQAKSPEDLRLSNEILADY